MTPEQEKEYMETGRITISDAMFKKSTPLWKQGWDERQSEIDHLTARLAEAEAVIARLPNTADGVACIPQERKWIYHPSHLDNWFMCANQEEAVGMSDSRIEGVWVSLSDCYSTRAAAEAALTSNQEK